MIMVRLSICYVLNDKANSCDCSNRIDSVGNQRCRMIIKLHVDEYMNSNSRVEKSKIVSKIVNNINNSAADGSYGAGFVRKVSRYGTTVLCPSSCKTWTQHTLKIGLSDEAMVQSPAQVSERKGFSSFAGWPKDEQEARKRQGTKGASTFTQTRTKAIRYDML